MDDPKSLGLEFDDETIVIDLDDELFEKLTEEAEQAGLSFEDYATKLLEEIINEAKKSVAHTESSDHEASG